MVRSFGNRPLKLALGMLAWAAAASTAPTEDKKAYDYIIVGGGTAGTALATRLSQGLSKHKILLLEAGPAALDDPRINAPGMRGSTLGSELDWAFWTTPQENLNGRKVDVPRGKVLGGSSAINYLCYDRAAEAEYDAWGELGNSGWNWDVMIDAMLKTENYTGKDDGDKHGRKGPIKTTYNRFLPAVLDTWKPTMNKLGIPTNDQSIGGNPVGVSFQPTNIDVTHWNRSYSANSYLPLAGNNLEVRTNTRVAKIDFTSDSKSKKLRAVGVTLTDGTKLTAAHEIVLSAGTIQSPGLLESSGIGQAAVLKAAKVEPILELGGVGENLQDHIRVSNTYKLKPGIASADYLIYGGDAAYQAQQLQLWLDGKPSWYGNTSTAYAFLNWGQVAGKGEKELLRLADEAQGKRQDAVGAKILEHLKDKSVPSVEMIMENNYVGAKGYPGSGNFITMFSTIMRPMSKGNIHINGSDAGPAINPKYLSTEYDVQALIAASKFTQQLANTEPMKSLWVEEYEPGPEVKTDAQWKDFVKRSQLSFFHPVGTCAMLPKKNGGVVDEDLVVYGTDNLRVVDASIIPVLLSGHIQTAVYGIAEIAAKKIIKDA